METLRVAPNRTALLVIDIQDKLSQAMDQKVLAKVERNVGILAQTAGLMKLPTLVTEQYPKGLGPTRPAVKEAVEPLAVTTFEKTAFSVCGAAPFDAAWADIDRDTWVVAGMETHVCVYQTVRDLCARGAAVHVVADAVCSRATMNWERGLKLCKKTGAVITTTETVCFDLLADAKHEHFKAISRAVR